MRTETDIELEQFVTGELDGGNRVALRGHSPAFEVRSHSTESGAQRTVVYHEGRPQFLPDDALAASEAEDKSDERKRKDGRVIVREHRKKLLDEVIALIRDAGYLDAGGVVRGGEFLIFLDGFGDGEGV